MRGCLLALLSAAGALPQGLLPLRRDASHDRRLRRGGPDALAACDARQRRLRELLAPGALRDAMDLALALDEDARGRLPAGCAVEAFHAGAADVVTRVETPRRGRNPLDARR